jgi:hypothetical protein
MNNKCPERRQEPAGVLINSFFGSHSSAAPAPDSASIPAWCFAIAALATPASGMILSPFNISLRFIGLISVLLFLNIIKNERNNNQNPIISNPEL